MAMHVLLKYFFGISGFFIFSRLLSLPDGVLSIRVIAESLFEGGFAFSLFLLGGAYIAELSRFESGVYMKVMKNVFVPLSPFVFSGYMDAGVSGLSLLIYASIFLFWHLQAFENFRVWYLERGMTSIDRKVFIIYPPREHGDLIVIALMYFAVNAIFFVFMRFLGFGL